jgi:aryl-alcohol dehydrogenase-like predicted oxidoreductase
VSPSQLALAWIMSKEILPIPGTKRRKYVVQNITATAINWSDAGLGGPVKI